MKRIIIIVFLPSLLRWVCVCACLCAGTRSEFLFVKILVGFRCANRHLSSQNYRCWLMKLLRALSRLESRRNYLVTGVRVCIVHKSPLHTPHTPIMCAQFIQALHTDAWNTRVRSYALTVDDIRAYASCAVVFVSITLLTQMFECDRFSAFFHVFQMHRINEWMTRVNDRLYN